MDKNSNPASDSSEDKEQASESALSPAEKYETRDNEATRKDARQSLFVGGLPYEGRKCYSISHVLTYLGGIPWT